MKPPKKLDDREMHDSRSSGSRTTIWSEQPYPNKKLKDWTLDEMLAWMKHPDFSMSEFEKVLVPKIEAEIAKWREAYYNMKEYRWDWRRKALDRMKGIAKQKGEIEQLKENVAECSTELGEKDLEIAAGKQIIEEDNAQIEQLTNRLEFCYEKHPYLRYSSKDEKSVPRVSGPKTKDSFLLFTVDNDRLKTLKQEKNKLAGARGNDLIRFALLDLEIASGEIRRHEFLKSTANMESAKNSIIKFLGKTTTSKPRYRPRGYNLHPRNFIEWLWDCTTTTQLLEVRPEPDDDPALVVIFYTMNFREGGVSWEGVVNATEIPIDTLLDDDEASE